MSRLKIFECSRRWSARVWGASLSVVGAFCLFSAWGNVGCATALGKETPVENGFYYRTFDDKKGVMVLGATDAVVKRK
ncbi:MAG: hypothetical protein IKW13_05130, partial [Thermoguttaceae bacterium]|nr:hypothetical protein [Thermoguttaceae bacterium]